MKKLLEKATDWAARVAGAQDAVRELHDTDRELREALAGAQRERARLLSAPPPAEEVVTAMVRVVDGHAAAWAQERAPGLVRAFGPGLELQSDGTLHARPAGFPDWFYVGDLRFKDLVGALPELWKPRLAAVIRGYAYDAGPAQADRARLVAEADAGIAELEREHTALVDMAASLTPPITLELLPAVKDQRAAEAARRQREPRVEQDRQATEAALDTRHAQQPRTAASEYLTRDRAR